MCNKLIDKSTTVWYTNKQNRKHVYVNEKKQMCVDFHAYLSDVTHMRQELTVWQIKSHFSIVCRFYLFSFYSIN